MAQRTKIPMGPQHPVLPEPIQLSFELEDEKIISAMPNLGYIHRGIEKLAEQNDIFQNVYLVERICGICSFLHSLCYCLGIEKMMNIKVPPRADYLRVIWSELHRLHSHHLWLGLMADAFGFESLFMQIWRNREMVLDIMEKTAGNRIIISTCQIGGVRRDISSEHLDEIMKMTKNLKKELDRVIPVLFGDKTVRLRTQGKGILTAESAMKAGAVGPVLRACGVAQDMRSTGYSAYSELKFEPVVENSGDAYARMMVRARETYKSIDMIRQAIEKMPEGDISVPVRGNPEGRTVSRVEQPRGELLMYIEGNGTKNLERLRVRTPTFANLPALLEMLPGHDFASAPILILSIDPCVSCTER